MPALSLLHGYYFIRRVKNAKFESVSFRNKVVAFMTKKPVGKFSTEDLIVSKGRGK